MTESSVVPDSHRHLLETPGIAVFTTIAADGYPQTSAIRFDFDGETVSTSTHRTRQRYRNILGNPKVSLFVVDPENPLRTVEVRGDATVEDDADKAYIRHLIGRYGLAVDSFGAPLDDRVIVRIAPRRIRITD